MCSIAEGSLGFSLLNDFQHGFPLDAQPFAHIAHTVGSTHDAVLATYAELRQSGCLSRIGAVFAPRRMGASTLAALAVPVERLDAVAAMVSQFAEVNHNYEREHRFNLWFVVTAPSSARLDAVLAGIETRCALPVLRLPLEEQFHIDLGFRLCQPPGTATARKTASVSTAPYEPTASDQTLIHALQGGLPLVRQPYAQLAQQLGWSEAQVIERIAAWLHNGLIKRFGVVVRHHELGFTANAMVVHNVPDDLVSQLGQQIGQHPGVTLCYRRPRVGTQWPYNLFCMLHGRERSEVERQIAQLRSAHGLLQYPHEILFSRTRYKQQGAYYADGAPPPVTAPVPAPELAATLPTAKA